MGFGGGQWRRGAGKASSGQGFQGGGGQEGTGARISIPKGCRQDLGRHQAWPWAVVTSRGHGGLTTAAHPGDPQQPPCFFPRNFRKHLRMVGSRRVKAQSKTPGRWAGGRRCSPPGLRGLLAAPERPRSPNPASTFLPAPAPAPLHPLLGTWLLGSASGSRPHPQPLHRVPPLAPPLASDHPPLGCPPSALASSGGTANPARPPWAIRGHPLTFQVPRGSWGGPGQPA